MVSSIVWPIPRQGHPQNDRIASPCTALEAASDARPRCRSERSRREPGRRSVRDDHGRRPAIAAHRLEQVDAQTIRISLKNEWKAGVRAVLVSPRRSHALSTPARARTIPQAGGAPWSARRATIPSTSSTPTATT